MSRLSLVCVFLLSNLNSFSNNEVKFIWSGAITPNTARVNVGITYPSDSVRLVYSLFDNFSIPSFTDFQKIDTSSGLAGSFYLENLAPGVKYFYAIEIDNNLDISEDDIGSFITFENKPFSFRFVSGSCAQNSDHPVYRVMKDLEPLFYINLGDLHYADPTGTDVFSHRQAYYDHVLSKDAAASFFKEVPIAYVWDDHDFSGNGSNRYSPGKAAAIKAFKDYVPHYPFGSGPVNQAFTVGRLRFILTDTRSERDPNNIMSEDQKIWFKNECVNAKKRNQIIVWVSSVSWAGTLRDNWSTYRTERIEFANFFRDANISDMFILCGDAHMIAIDDGSGNNFSTGKRSRFKYPIFQTAALNRMGSDKGGKYSHGTYPNPSFDVGQFGLIEINDDGDEKICIKLSGYRVTSDGNSNTLVDYEFCRNLSDHIFLRVYPNPAKTKSFIEISNITETAGVTIKLIDLAGNIKNSIEATLEPGDNLIEMNIEGTVSPGIYVIFFNYNGKIHSSRLVVR